MKYKIIRFFQAADVESYTIRKNLTLAAAQAHCRNPETSSSTATSKRARTITELMGPWFDGYEKQTSKGANNV